jgi:DNA (cytosine-5)-methyltransferase 1
MKIKQTKRRIRLNSFFAGIGGFDLGFERSGVEIAFQCEIDDFCRSVLKRHWPQAEVNKNIKTVDLEGLPNAEIWCGGFPCQDVSVARGWLGRDGLRGKQSGLFHVFLDLIAARHPRVVLLENVTGLLSSHSGLDFEFVLKSLADLGYGVAWRVLNSRYFGAPQSRPRVFICAWLRRPASAIRALYESQVSGWPASERKGFLTPCPRSSSGAMVPEVAYCLAATSGRHTGTDWSRSYVSYHDKVRRLTPPECEGLQGFPNGWTLPEPNVKLAENELDSLRYAALGNAVSVPVVEWIAKRIKKELQTESKERIATIDLLTPFPTDQPKSVLRLGDVKDSRGKFKWSTGGFAWRGNCLVTAVSPSRVEPVTRFLVDVLEHNSVSEGHFLSPNAAEGILRRVRGQNRTLFGPLEDALQRLRNQDPQISEKAETTLPLLEERPSMISA